MGDRAPAHLDSCTQVHSAEKAAVAQPWTGGDAQQVLVHVVIDSDSSHASSRESLRAAGTGILRVGFSLCLITPSDRGLTT